MTSTKSQPVDVASEVPDAATDLPETALDQIQGGLSLNWEPYQFSSAPTSGQPRGPRRSGVPVNPIDP